MKFNIVGPIFHISVDADARKAVGYRCGDKGQRILMIDINTSRADRAPSGDNVDNNGQGDTNLEISN